MNPIAIPLRVSDFGAGIVLKKPGFPIEIADFFSCLLRAVEVVSINEVKKYGIPTKLPYISGGKEE